MCDDFLKLIKEMFSFCTSYVFIFVFIRVVRPSCIFKMKMLYCLEDQGKCIDFFRFFFI